MSGVRRHYTECGPSLWPQTARCLAYKGYVMTPWWHTNIDRGIQRQRWCTYPSANESSCQTDSRRLKSGSPSGTVAISSKKRLFTSTSQLYKWSEDNKWTIHSTRFSSCSVRAWYEQLGVNTVDDVLRKERQQWMRLTYHDIVLDREAWDPTWPRPEWVM